MIQRAEHACAADEIGVWFGDRESVSAWKLAAQVWHPAPRANRSLFAVSGFCRLDTGAVRHFCAAPGACNWNLLNYMVEPEYEP